ncbi:MAG TPA: PAS domain S-box protein, partial [Pyrinomonadaceae bacterium]|nr:PAS domain S-box protein [Pyrinomonadaceae bacterium]
LVVQHYADSEVYAERDVEFLSSVGSQMALVIERVRAEEALRESEAKFKELFDHAPVAYHELDREGRIVKVNLTEQRLLGYSAEELEGRHAWNFVVEKASQGALAARLTGNVPLQPLERTFIRKDGSFVSLMIHDQLISDKSGYVTGLRSTLHDITQRKQLEAELQEARDVAIESARLKSEFVENMSHDIRTPMNVVMGMTGLLLETELSVDQRDFAETIRASADSLLTIINARTTGTADSLPVDLEQLSQAMGDDLHEILDLYLRQIPQSLEKLRVGISSGNTKAVDLIAHNCADTSANCGMVALVTPFRELERASREGNLEHALPILEQAWKEFARVCEFLETHLEPAVA